MAMEDINLEDKDRDNNTNNNQKNKTRASACFIPVVNLSGSLGSMTLYLGERKNEPILFAYT